MNRKDWLKSAGILGVALMTQPLKGMPFWLPNNLHRSDFGPDFAWGVATAAYQIEGAWQADGKGESIWDHFTHRKGKIKDKSNGDTACDFYHRYADDLALMAQMNIPNNRFSLAWSRIFPEGKGSFNEKGLAYYDRVIDTTLEKGMTPWLTCYHWDLPQALEDLGGWTNRDVIGWFGDYVDLVTTRFADRVENWMVLNEPMAFTALGYGLGMHAPGRKGWKNFLKATHHASMCQAEGARIIRANVPKAHIGTTFSASHIVPVDERPKNKQAAVRMDALFNRLFLEPALGLGYPIDDVPALKKIRKYIKDGDEQKLAFDYDFIGLQNYTREVIKKSIVPYAKALMVKPAKRGVPEDQITEMGWEVYPEGIYELLKKFHAYPQIKKIIVTENGSAFPDQVTAGRVHDQKRKKYLQDYLTQVLRAKKEGVPVEGYFVWTFMDNFEWAEGYEPRFGLVHVDFATQKRIVKDSGRWLQDFLAGK